MNIFVTSACPEESAKALDDKRVIKMILESAQLLSTSINYYSDNQGPYKSTHINHPCAVWARKNKGNYLWLYYHYIALCNEYRNRFNRIHKCEHLKDRLAQGIVLIPDGPRTEFANCAAHQKLGLDYKQINPVTLAYQLYLNDRWDMDKRTPTWYREERL